MKRVFGITVGFMVLTGMVLSASAQTRPATPQPTPQPTPAATVPAAAVPASKIALVDTTMFGDEKLGIKRYIAAVKTVRTELQPREAEILALENQLKTLADEMTKLRANPIANPDSIKAKQAEGERVQLDYTNKTDSYKSDLAKRYDAVVGPVSAAIGKALDQYATQRGLTMVLDISKLLPAVLTINQNMDITQAFISDYNSKNP